MSQTLDNFRLKFPEYSDMSDLDLATKLVSKHPEYQDILDEVKSTTVSSESSVSSEPSFMSKVSGGIKNFFTVPTEETPKETPEFFQKHPNLYGLYGAGKGLLNKMVRPSVETVAATVGATAGTPILGGALGLGIGAKAMDIAEKSYAELGGEETPDTTIGEELLDSAKTVGTAIAIGKGFEVGATAIDAATTASKKYLFDALPDRLYASAVKLPLSKRWTKILPGEEISMRQEAVHEGLSEGVPTGKFGYVKATALEKEAKLYIDDVTSALDDNPGNTINVKEVLDRGLKKAYSRASVSSDPVGANKVIQTIHDKFSAHGETLTPSQANAIKRQLYKEAKWDSASSTAISSQISVDAKKGIANELMLDLEKLYPELNSLNKTDASRIYLKEAIEMAYGRSMSSDLIGLGPKILTRPKVWPLAMFDAVVGMPSVKSRLAIALAKANPTKYSKFVYPEMPEGYIPTPIEKKAGVYRYSPELQTTKSVVPQTIEQLTGNKSLFGEPIPPPDVPKNKMQSAKEAFDEERARFLEKQFEAEKLARVKEEGSKGSPLTMPQSTVGQRSPVPQTVEQLVGQRSPVPQTVEQLVGQRSPVPQTVEQLVGEKSSWSKSPSSKVSTKEIYSENLGSLFTDRDTLTLSEAFKRAKEKGLVKTPEDFKNLLGKEVRAGTIDGGRGTASKDIKDRKLGNEEVGVTGYIKKVDSQNQLNMMIPLDQIPQAVKDFYTGSKKIIKNAATATGDVMSTVASEDLYRNKELFQKTGFWLGKDGKWRYEINNYDDFYLGNNFESLGLNKRWEGKLQDILKNDKLFEAIPEIKDTGVIIRPGKKGGTYYPNSDTIEIGNNNVTSLVHEIQHAVNNKVSGTFKGTNEVTVGLKSYLHEVAERLNFLALNSKDKSTKINVQQELYNLQNEINKGNFNPEVKDWYNTNFLPFVKRNESKEIYNHMAFPIKPDATRAYLGDPGEMEARLTVKRFTMSPEQKAAEAPWETLEKMLKDEGEIFPRKVGSKLYTGLPLLGAGAAAMGGSEDSAPKKEEDHSGIYERFASGKLTPQQLMAFDELQRRGKL